MQRTQAPFRANVVGSLLRPAAIKQARQRFADGEIDAALLRAVEGNEIVRVVAEQRALGAAGRYGRRVPPRLVAYGFL